MAFSLTSILKEGKQLAIYGLGSIAQSALSFLLLPIFLKYFSPSEYGIITLLLLVQTFIIMFFTAGMMGALQRIYFAIDLHNRKIAVGTTIIFYLFSAGLITAALFIFSKPVSSLLFKNENYYFEIMLLGIMVFFTFINDVPFNILRLEKRAKLYVILSIFQFVLGFAMKYIFIVVLHDGIAGYFKSSVIELTCIGVLLFILTRRSIILKISPVYFKQLLRLGIPFIFSGFAMWLLTAFDKFFINFFWGESDLGIYALGFKFSNIFNIFLLKPFALFLPPVILSYAESRKPQATKIFLQKLLIVLLLFGGIGYLVISLCSRYLIQIMVGHFDANPDYLSSLPLIPILTIAPFLYFIEQIAGYSLLIVKKPEFTSLSCIITAVLNIVLNIILVYFFKEIGAAVALAISYLIYVILVYFWSALKYPNNFKIFSYLKILFFIIIIFIAMYLLPIQNPFAGFLLCILASIIILPILVFFFSGFFNKDNRKKYFHQFLSLLRRRPS